MPGGALADAKQQASRLSPSGRGPSSSDKAVQLHHDAHEDGGLACNNDELLKQQRKAIMEWVKSMGQRLLTGQVNLINTPFPVIMFEPRSYLEKLADVWVYPKYLSLAARATSPMERMKWTVTWFIAGLHHGFEQWRKPFNPILGETWQARLRDGTSIAIEQISHHPPVSAFRMDGPGGAYSFVGLSQPSVTLLLKHYGFKTVAKGFRHVDFADGTRIEMLYPSYSIKGVVNATRPYAEVEGKAVFTDSKSQLKAVVTFGAIKGAKSALLRRSDAVSGGIYDCSNGEVHHSAHSHDPPPPPLAASVAPSAASCSPHGSDDDFASASENEFDADVEAAEADAAASEAALVAAVNGVNLAASPPGSARGLEDDGGGRRDGKAGGRDPHDPPTCRPSLHNISPSVAGTSTPPIGGASAKPAAGAAAQPPLPDAGARLPRLSGSGAPKAPTPLPKTSSTGSSMFGSFGNLGRALGLTTVEKELPPGELLCQLEGSWLSHLDCGGQRTWTLVEDAPDVWQPIPDALPSDSRFRMDLTVLKSGDVRGAQEWKERLEHEQRADKKLRGGH